MGKPQTKELRKSTQEKDASKRLLQWHPAFCAGVQIELEGESESLILKGNISLEENQNRSIS